MPVRDGKERALALGGVIGPAAFLTAWSVLGARAEGYSPVHDAISQLAATGAPSRAAMTGGLVVFGVGTSLYGAALRTARPGRAWAAAVATGVAALGVAAFPLGPAGDDAVHGAFAGAGYLSLAALPWLAAGPLAAEGRPGWAWASRAVAVVTAAGLLATALAEPHGLFQRAGLTAGHLWVMASAVDLLRRPRAYSGLRTLS